jgi:hypothetical protein
MPEMGDDKLSLIEPAWMGRLIFQGLQVALAECNNFVVLFNL